MPQPARDTVSDLLYHALQQKYVELGQVLKSHDCFAETGEFVWGDAVFGGCHACLQYFNVLTNKQDLLRQVRRKV
jgi:hypothetical protein